MIFDKTTVIIHFNINQEDDLFDYDELMLTMHVLKYCNMKHVNTSLSKTCSFIKLVGYLTTGVVFTQLGERSHTLEKNVELFIRKWAESTSPDMKKIFTINALDVMERIIFENPIRGIKTMLYGLKINPEICSHGLIIFYGDCSKDKKKKVENMVNVAKKYLEGLATSDELIKSTMIGLTF